MKLHFFSVLAAFCLIALATPSAHAQELPFTFEFEDTTAVVGMGPVGTVYKNFYVYITNTSGSDQPLIISRTSNALPNDSWSSSICTEAICYPTTLDEIDPITFAPKQRIRVYLTINGGENANEQATVELRFANGTFGPALTQQFTLMVATSSVLAESRQAVRVAPVPNPASTSTLLPADIVSTDGMSVRLYDPLGRMAADLSSTARMGNGGVQISLDGLAEGTYFYQLETRGYRGTGTLVVSR